MSDLICPKCQGAMRQYERAGVTVDQCSECRGIFLDRGELERLVDAENQWNGGQQQHAPPPPQQPQQPYPNQGGYYGRQSPPPGYGRQSPPPGYGQHGGQYRRKRSFLDNLFD